MTQCGITPSELETLAMDRTGWRSRSTCKSAVEEFEVRRIQELELVKRDLRKSGPPSTSNFECQICHRMCRSRIGLLAHNKSHSWWWDPSYRRLSHDIKDVQGCILQRFLLQTQTEKCKRWNLIQWSHIPQSSLCPLDYCNPHCANVQITLLFYHCWCWHCNAISAGQFIILAISKPKLKALYTKDSGLTSAVSVANQLHQALQENMFYYC